MNKLVQVDNLTKRYQTRNGEITALDNLSFSLNENEFLSIIGSSGCGKSTLLNILANLDDASSGTITKKDNLKVGYMLQDDALLPWLNVLDNACLGLDITRKKNPSSIAYVKELLTKYGLEDFIYKHPSELSGGMKKRVALIRTLAIKPDVLLLDEPFSALDYVSKLIVSNDVFSIIKKEHKSVILITHDIGEAISLANRVIVLSKRPAKIKNIYDIELSSNSPMEKRKDPKFSYYYDLLWKDLDKDV